MTKHHVDGEWIDLEVLEDSWRKWKEWSSGEYRMIGREELRELNDKLKAVKSWAEEINGRRWTWDEISVDPVTMIDMGNLMEILGVKVNERLG